MLSDAFAIANVNVTMEVGENPGMAVINGALVLGKEKCLSDSGLGNRMKRTN